VRKVGLFATAGRPEPEPPPPPAGPLVAIAVGKTKEGESFPANPNLENPVPLYASVSSSAMGDRGGGSKTSAGLDWARIGNPQRLTCP